MWSIPSSIVILQRKFGRDCGAGWGGRQGHLVTLNPFKDDMRYSYPNAFLKRFVMIAKIVM